MGDGSRRATGIVPCGNAEEVWSPPELLRENIPDGLGVTASREATLGPQAHDVMRVRVAAQQNEHGLAVASFGEDSRRTRVPDCC